MCESIERAVAQRGSDYAVRFECVCVCGGERYDPWQKPIICWESLHHQAHPERLPWNKTSSILSEPPLSELIVAVNGAGEVRDPTHPCWDSTFLPSTSLNHRALASGKKVHNFCCCYVGIESRSQSVPSADYLCDKHMPAHWFSAFECRCLDSRPARARTRTQGQKSIDATADAEGPASRRESRISARCALTNEDAFFFMVIMS